jgi:hypothetical protein
MAMMRPLLIALALAAAVPAAAVTLDERGCAAYASWSGNLVWARGLGADKAKAHAEIVALDREQPGTIYQLLLRDFDALWRTTADWRAVMLATYRDCVLRRGQYGTDA